MKYFLIAVALFMLFFACFYLFKHNNKNYEIPLYLWEKKIEDFEKSLK